MAERVDLRTPHEKEKDALYARMGDRFLELMEYSPSISRAVAQVAKEFETTRQTCRLRLIRAGVYHSGTRPGNGNGCSVIPRQ